MSLWTRPVPARRAPRGRHAGDRDRARTPTAGYWAYATLNDAFTVRRRCRKEDAIFGLGEKSGRHNRKGRDFTLWNTDVLSPDAAGGVHGRAGRRMIPARTARASSATRTTSSIPFFYHQAYPTGPMAASFVDNGYRGDYELHATRTVPGPRSRGGQYTEYVFAGPGHAGDPRGLHLADRADGAAAAVVAGVPPVPLVRLHPGRGRSRWRARHRDLDIPCDALWLDIEHMDGYRVFTWDSERLSPIRRHAVARLAEQGFRVITIVDPGVKYDPGYWVFDQARERDVLCRTEGGDIYIGQVWPGNTAFPDFVTEEARTWWGELNAAHVRSGLAGIWNDMNEPATGAIPPADALRPRPLPRTSAITTSTRC